MYNALQYGNNWDGYNIQDLNTSLSRMSAIGAISLTIPGPKMIWHFSDLGMENSLFTCSDGTVNEPDCKLDTKPQPQWVDNWLENVNRREVYDNWARIIDLKINEDVFEGNYSISSGSLTPIIYIWDDGIDSNLLKNVVVVSNFDVVEQTITPYFPYTGTWFDLMDENGESSINVNSTSQQITLQPGEFKIFGNQSSITLSQNEYEIDDVYFYPNPSEGYINFNKGVDLIEIYDITGKIVVTLENTVKNRPINIDYLDTGLYLVKISNDNLLSKKTLIIK